MHSNVADVRGFVHLGYNTTLHVLYSMCMSSAKVCSSCFFALTSLAIVSMVLETEKSGLDRSRGINLRPFVSLETEQRIRVVTCLHQHHCHCRWQMSLSLMEPLDYHSRSATVELCISNFCNCESLLMVLRHSARTVNNLSRHVSCTMNR